MYLSLSLSLSYFMKKRNGFSSDQTESSSVYIAAGSSEMANNRWRFRQPVDKFRITRNPLDYRADKEQCCRSRRCVEGVKERGLIGADNPVACGARGEERQNAWKVERKRERERERRREKREGRNRRGIKPGKTKPAGR